MNCYRSSPRVSFQEEAINRSGIPPKRKSFSTSKQRASAVPEMSDISEHSISEEQYDRVTRPSSNSAKPVGKPVVPRKFSVTPVHEQLWALGIFLPQDRDCWACDCSSQAQITNITSILFYSSTNNITVELGNFDYRPLVANMLSEVCAHSLI